MSDRLTNKWTNTAEEAFGATGAKGRLGEEFLMEVFKSWGWDYIDHENDKKMQMLGVDLSFKSPTWANYYTCDVKNNMTEYGGFYVGGEWINKIKTNRVFHVNPNTGWVTWYDTEEMREYYNKAVEGFSITNPDPYSRDSRIYVSKGGGLSLYLKPSNRPDFVKARKSTIILNKCC